MVRQASACLGFDPSAEQKADRLKPVLLVALPSH